MTLNHDDLLLKQASQELFQSLNPHEKTFLARHQNMVRASGGIIEDHFFVTKPGCIMLASTQVTNEAETLFCELKLDGEATGVERFVELCSRMTYLSFRDKADSSQAYHEKMAKELGHLSVWGAVSVSFLLSGLSIESSMELLAHSEAKAARLTSSKTKAMDLPLFRVQGNAQEQAFQKNYLLQQLKQRKEQDLKQSVRNLSPQANEFFNILSPGAKASSVVYTMNLKDFHKLFIGRLSDHGNEWEVQELCKYMCTILHANYPIVIRSMDEYYQMNNSAKYSI